jgi:hypothetical protein
MLLLLLLMCVVLPGYGQATQTMYQEQDSARFRVVYALEDAGVMPGFWQTLRGGVPAIERSIGLGLADTVTFVIAPTEREWGRLTQGAPLWANGITESARGLAIVKSPRFGLRYGPLPVTALHEYVHLLLHSGAPRAQIPHWLDEGLAQVLSGQFDFMDTEVLARAAAAGRLHTLDQLEGLMGMSAPDARQGYAESAAAVRLLQKKFGNAGLSNLVHELRSGRDFYDAFSTVFGMSIGTFETQYLGSVRSSYRLPFFGDTELWVSGIFVLLVLASGVAVWKRRKRTLERWKEEDRRFFSEPSGAPPPYTINYEIIRSRMQGENEPPKEEDHG